jgi:hypothetical protein
MRYGIKIISHVSSLGLKPPPGRPLAASGPRYRNEHIARARGAGATDLEIHDAVLITAAFCMFNRYVDGLATIAPGDPALYAAGAQHLVKEGYLPPPAI